MSAPEGDVSTNSTRVLAEFVAGLTYGDIPDAVLEHARLCLLDTLGCALFGSTLPWTRIVTEMLASLGPGEHTVFGTAGRLRAPDAALANGTAVHAFELDDLHPRSIVHPGSVVMPAAFAVGASTGGALLVALVAGYEVAARVGMSVGAAHLIAGWHPTGTHGTLGAAAAAGSVLRLSPAEMQNALGIAGSQSSGLMASQYGSMVKRFHAGRAAQSGVYAALLAQRGFTGIADLFEADYGGYGSTFSPVFDPAALTAGLGRVWETSSVGFKVYSTNGSCHPTIDALRELRAREGLRADDVAALDVFVSSATLHHVGWHYVPDSVTTAQMNLSYIAAVVLHDGDAFVEQFDEARIAEPGLVELASRVHVHADPEIDAAGDGARHRTRVVVTRNDGSELSIARDHARGSAHDPIPVSEVRAKFRRLAAKAIDDETVVRLEQLVTGLGRNDSIAPVLECLVTLDAKG